MLAISIVSNLYLVFSIPVFILDAHNKLAILAPNKYEYTKA